VRADGSSASEVALWEACRSAEAAVQAAERGVAEGQAVRMVQSKASLLAGMQCRDDIVICHSAFILYCDAMLP